MDFDGIRIIRLWPPAVRVIPRGTGRKRGRMSNGLIFDYLRPNFLTTKNSDTSTITTIPAPM